MFITVFLVCLAASTIGGICGIGGGVVIKPILDALGIMSVSTVSFLSGLTVLSMSIVSVWKNRKGRELDPVRSIPLGIGAAIGGLSGKKLFELIRSASSADAVLGALQAGILALLVLGTFLYVQNKAKIRPRNIKSPLAGMCIGLMLGVCSSFLGIGGGPMNLAVLYYFFSMDTKKAAVNSILVILLSQSTSFISTLISRSVPAFDPLILASMVLAGILGGLVSAKLHKKLSVRTTDKLFSGLLIVIILICIYNLLRFMA